MEREIARVVEFIKKGQSRFSARRNERALQVTLHSRTPNNLRKLRRDVVRLFGRPSGRVYRGREEIRAPWGRIWISRQSQYVKPPDLSFYIDPKHQRIVTRKWREKAEQEAREVISGSRLTILRRSQNIGPGRRL